MKQHIENRGGRGVALAEDDDGSVQGVIRGVPIMFGSCSVAVDVEVILRPAGGWDAQTRARFQSDISMGGSFARGELRHGLAGAVARAAEEAALELERRELA